MPAEILGTWVRVMDGCDPLNEEQLVELEKNGGSNSLVRSTVFSVKKDGTFAVERSPSPRCEADFKAYGVPSTTSFHFCSTDTTEGTITISGSDRFSLKATRGQKVKDGWGVRYKHWHFTRRSSLLILQTKTHICPDRDFFVYLIQGAAV